MDVRLQLITVVAAAANGALGYGFSSIAVPLALLFMTNRQLNPLLVVTEVFLNASSAAVNGRDLRRMAARVAPLLVGLPVGIALGTAGLAAFRSQWLRLATFALLLPLVLMQVAGLRRPLPERTLPGVLLGCGVGGLYALTTISGPPLAILLNNQGLSKGEFRGAMALLRLAESVLTAAAYAAAGLLTIDDVARAMTLWPGIALALVAGAWGIRRVDAEAFRRAAMGFDAVVVAFGLATVAVELGLVSAPVGLVAFGGLSAAVPFILRRSRASPGR